jgi:hypothetical protein
MYPVQLAHELFKSGALFISSIPVYKSDVVLFELKFLERQQPVLPMF